MLLRSFHFARLPGVPLGAAGALLLALVLPAGAQSPQPEPKAPPREKAPPAEQSRPKGDGQRSDQGPQTLPKSPPGPGGSGDQPAAADAGERRPVPVPKAPQTAAEKAKQLSDLYALLATAENEEAAGKFAAAIERLWAFSGSDTTNLLIERANAAQKQKRTELADKLLDYAVTVSPDYTEAFSQRAFFHFQQNNFDAAVGDLRRVLALDPNHYKAIEGLVQIWRETGNKKAAFGLLRQLLEIHPFAAGAKAALDELKREVEGQGI
jgi:tetratricopeptide (TPR) repeat protein